MNKCPDRDLKCPYSLMFPDIDSPLPCCATQKQCNVFLKENPKEIEDVDIPTDINKDCKNTDREIWRKIPGDYYSPSIHVTEDNKGIGIDCGGYVMVKPVEEWHKCGKILNPNKPSWVYKLAMWLLS